MEEEALLRRAREDAKRIVMKLKNNPHGSPVAAPARVSETPSEISISTRSLAGRIVRQTETNVIEEASQEAEISRLRKRVAQLEEELMRRQSRSAPKILPAFVNEMSRLEEGLWAAKLSQGLFGYRRLQQRYLFVKQGRLWWNSSGHNLDTSEKSSVSLNEVVHMEFCPGDVAELMKSENWRCISFFTKKRSFDWKIEDEEDLAALMVVLGRLCVNAVGGAKTRSEVICKRAVAKIRNKCRKEKISLTQLFVEALNRRNDGTLRNV